MKGGTIFGLVVFLLWMITIVKSDGTIDDFVGDIISTFKLMSPTIIYSYDEAPEICWSKEWLLCLKAAEHYEVAEHIHRLFIDRKQDSLILLGHEDQAPLLLEKLSDLEPTLFRWSSPVFMPIRFVLDISLRLDSNILFYEKTRPGNYNLIDIFAVKGGPNIWLGVGVWDKINGMKVYGPVGRWDRRRDLKQTEITNSIYRFSSSNYVILILEENCLPPDDAHFEEYCNITHSDGFFQEKLFYITEGLNLSIKIVFAQYEDLILEDGSWGGEIGQLERREADVFSNGLLLKEDRKEVIDFTLPISHDYYVLAASIPKGRIPSMWAYVNVFRMAQWIIFFASLLGIVLLMSTIHTISTHIQENSWTRNLLSASEMAFLFLLQSGNHLNDGHSCIRILSITLSLLTLLFFVYYANDITADMTSGPPPLPVKTFEDVITYGYKIFVMRDVDEDFFSNADPETARYRIYETNLVNIDNITAYLSLRHLEELIEDPMALLFTDRLSLIPEYSVHFDGEPDFYVQYLLYLRYLLSQIMTLPVDGAPSSFSSFALQKQSEFLGPFNYFLMKQNEHGISSRLFRKYHMPLYIKEQFGLIEPRPLGHEDVMFLFILLGLGMLTSLAIACLEMLRKICRKRTSKGHAKKKVDSEIQQTRETTDIEVTELHH